MLLSSEVVDIDGVPYSLSAGVDISERKRREKIQQATYQISETAHAAEDLSSLYPHIHKIIKGLMPADNFYIALFDPARELISFPYFVDERSEDEAETLENLVLMLEMEGFKPLSAPNGRAGVAVAKRELPDVILCDVSMPEMDG